MPAYRVPFFDQLADRLGAEGLALRVYHGAPSGDQARRNDSAAGPWSTLCPTRSLTVGHIGISYRPIVREVMRSALVVAELEATRLDTWQLAAAPRVKLALWGHGKSYVKRPSRVDSCAEHLLMRAADHIFTYTDHGAEAVRRAGIDKQKITAVQNSTDTRLLREVPFVEYPPVDESHVLFVGGLDSTKGLPLLLDAMAIVRTWLPHTKLVCLGDGPMRAELERHAPWVETHGHSDRAGLAKASRAAAVMAIPGRVGLVAVDAMALGLPVVTTNFPYHAPEFEYLDAATSIVTDETPSAFADGLLALLRDRERLAQARVRAHARGANFGIETMVDNFMIGIRSCLAAPVSPPS